MKASQSKTDPEFFVESSVPAEWQVALRVLWLAAVTMVIVLTCMPASSPVIKALDTLPVSDKVEHLAAYLALAFVPALHERRRVLVRIAVLLVVLGVALEFGQMLSEGRSFDVSDMVANLCGVVAGVVFGLTARPTFSGVVRGSLPEF